MHARIVAIIVIFGISVSAAIALSLAIPDFEGAVVVRLMAGVLGFFGAFIALAKMMTVVWPAPGMVAARAAKKAVRQAPSRAVSEAVAEVYVKARSSLSARRSRLL